MQAPIPMKKLGLTCMMNEKPCTSIHAFIHWTSVSENAGDLGRKRGGKGERKRRKERISNIPFAGFHHLTVTITFIRHIAIVAYIIHPLVGRNRTFPYRGLVEHDYLPMDECNV